LVIYLIEGWLCSWTLELGIFEFLCVWSWHS